MGKKFNKRRRKKRRRRRRRRRRRAFHRRLARSYAARIRHEDQLLKDVYFEDCAPVAGVIHQAIEQAKVGCRCWYGPKTWKRLLVINICVPVVVWIVGFVLTLGVGILFDVDYSLISISFVLLAISAIVVLLLWIPYFLLRKRARLAEEFIRAETESRLATEDDSNLPDSTLYDTPYESTTYPGVLIVWTEEDRVRVNAAHAPQIRSIQQALCFRRFDCDISGEYSEDFMGVLRQFQQTAGLVADGMLGPSTWRSVFSETSEETKWTKLPRSEDGATFGRILRFGKNGFDTRAVQKRLLQRGIGTLLNPNGLYEGSTVSSVKSFQKIVGLQETGIVDAETWSYLFMPNEPLDSELLELPSSPSGARFYRMISHCHYQWVREGHRGEDVLAVNERLKELLPESFPWFVHDGFDESYYRVVRIFQEQHDIEVTGLVDANTWRILFSDLLEVDSRRHLIPKSCYERLTYTYRLHPGCTGTRCTEIQNRLVQLRILGTSTWEMLTEHYPEEAIKNFQQSKGLEPNGIVDEITWSRLFEGEEEVDLIKIDLAPAPNGAKFRRVVMQGLEGEDVLACKMRLHELGHQLPSREDSSYDLNGETKGAVQAFQREKGLVSDGIIREDTWSALFGTLQREQEEEVTSEVGDSFVRLLQVGDRGRNVMIVQYRLITAFGSDPNVVGWRGSFTESTASAVQEFQARMNLGTSCLGQVDQTTWNALFQRTEQDQHLSSLDLGVSEEDGSVWFSRVMQPGMVGVDVLAIQKRLKILGLFPAIPDGVFGEMTEVAVQQFRTEMGLGDDLSVDAFVWKRLFATSDEEENEGGEGEMMNGEIIVTEID